MKPVSNKLNDLIPEKPTKTKVQALISTKLEMEIDKIRKSRGYKWSQIVEAALALFIEEAKK